MPEIPMTLDPFVYMSNERRVKTKSSVPNPNEPRKAREGFTFGGDPEFFLKNEKGVIVPGTADIIPGTKEAPHAVDKGAIQLDGVAAEININPAPTFEEWSGNIDTVVTQLKILLPKGWSLSTQPTVVFDKKVFDPVPDCHKVLGCSPDFNAWDMNINPPPELENPYMRCIGGHIHVGWPGGPFAPDNQQHILACADLVQQLDWFLGAWSLTKDTDTVRRKLYGKAGACRIKDYGVEYRVLSSFWVLDPILRLEVWNRMQCAIDQMSNYFMPERGGSSSSKINDMVIAAINTGTLTGQLQELGHYPILSLDTRYNRL